MCALEGSVCDHHKAIMQSVFIAKQFVFRDIMRLFNVKGLLDKGWGEYINIEAKTN